MTYASTHRVMTWYLFFLIKIETTDYSNIQLILEKPWDIDNWRGGGGKTEILENVVNTHLNFRKMNVKFGEFIATIKGQYVR